MGAGMRQRYPLRRQRGACSVRRKGSGAEDLSGQEDSPGDGVGLYVLHAGAGGRPYSGPMTFSIPLGLCTIAVPEVPC